MIRENTSVNAIVGVKKINLVSEKINFGSQQVMATSDTLKIKQTIPKLVIPKASHEDKLQRITEKIREVDPIRETVVKLPPKKEIVIADSLEKDLYNSDTIPYLLNEGNKEIIFSNNYFINIPDFKPKVVLVDSAAIKKDSIELSVSKPVKQQKETSLLYKFEKPETQNLFSAGWITIVLIGLVLLFAWIRVFYNKVLKLTVRSSYNYLISSRLYREKSSLTIWGSFILNIFYSFSVGFFLYLLLTYYGYGIAGYAGFFMYILIVLLLTLVYLVKQFALKIVAYIFHDKGELSEYIHNVYIFNKILGVIILPAVLAIPYIPEPGKEILLIIGVSAIFILYTLRIFRGLRIGFRINVSIFYLILYLCSLEFFPLLILYKVFVIYTS